MSPEFDEAIKATRNLPPMPIVTTKVMQMLSSDDFSNKDLGKVISNDSAMSARILKTVNSSLYGLRRNITTIEHAVSILGEQAIRTLVLTASLEVITKKTTEIEKSLWEDSVGCAIACKFIAAALPNAGVNPEEAFLIGLMRHIGKLAMCANNPRYFKSIFEASQQRGGQDTGDLERQYYTYNHSQMGSAVIKHWELSPVLSEIILLHELPYKINDVDCEDKKLITTIAILNLAENICMFLGIGLPEPQTSTDVKSCFGAKQLGVDETIINQLTEEILESFSVNKSTFEIN